MNGLLEIRQKLNRIFFNFLGFFGLLRNPDLQKIPKKIINVQ